MIKILDQRFRLTFYSGLYDTLLAENLDQARRIAYSKTTRYRVVTYKGEIIEQSGMPLLHLGELFTQYLFFITFKVSYLVVADQLKAKLDLKKLRQVMLGATHL